MSYILSIAKIKPTTTETYTFYLTHDDGSRLTLDRVVKINYYGTVWQWYNTFTQALTAGTYYDLMIEFFNNQGPVGLKLEWSSPTISKQLIPSPNLSKIDLVGSSPYQITVSWPTGYTGSDPTSPTTCKELWGDGIKIGTEECDDGNTIDSDGCSSDCTLITPGFIWTGGSIMVKDTWIKWTTGFYPDSYKTSCITRWGDSIKAGSEAWEDGNTTNKDGCSSSWTIESSYSWAGGSLTSIDTWIKWSSGLYQDISNPSKWIPKWGDGLRAGTEKWDDGNTSNSDGCKSDCTSVEDGYVCKGGSTTSKDVCTKWDKGYYQNDSSNPTECVTKWGDGIRAGPEICDDGNIIDGDGCSSAWITESGWAWVGGFIGVTDFWVQCPYGFQSNIDYQSCIGDDIPRNIQTMATVAAISTAMGIASNLLVAVLTSSSSSSSSFGMMNQIQLLILIPLIGPYIPSKIFDFIKAMSASLMNFNFMPTSNSSNMIDFKGQFTFSQPNSFLYLLDLKSGSAFVNILNLTSTVGMVIWVHLLILIAFMILRKVSRFVKLKKLVFAILTSLTFGFYIGVWMESAVLFLFVDFSEIHYQNKNGSQNIKSTVMSYVILLLMIFFVILTVWQWFKSRKPEVFETQKYFVALVEGMKPRWICRSYSTVFLLRRILFCAIVFFLEDKIEMIKRISLFVTIQILYLVYLIILRPLESFKENFSDLINEILYTYFATFLLYFNTEARWNTTAQDAYFWIIIATLVLSNLIKFNYKIILLFLENNI